MMDAQAVVVHSMPGRVRLRIQERDADPAFFSELPGELYGLGGVQNVKANPATRSVVIEFSGTLQNLAQQLRQHGLVVGDPPVSSDESIPASAKAGMKPLNLVSGRNIDAMFIAGSLLSIVGIIQTYRGRISVPAITAFWYALEAYRQSGQARQ